MRERLPIIVFALVMAVIPFIPGMPPFWIVLLDNIGLAALVAMGLVLLTGVGGLTSFGQAAFCGFGAYTTAVLTTAYGVSPWLTLPLSLLVSGFAAVALGLVTVRLSGHYLPLGTIAWGLGLFYLFSKLEFLGRNDGISGIPPLSIGGFRMIDPGTIYFAIWIAVLLSALLTTNLLDSRTGRAIRALPKRSACRRRARNFWSSSMRRCWPDCRAGSMRISSAPPPQPRSAPSPASNISLSLWSAAPAMSGAACWAPPSSWC
jgi:branched-chain amino acid transport system permease protein